MSVSPQLRRLNPLTANHDHLPLVSSWSLSIHHTETDVSRIRSSISSIILQPPEFAQSLPLPACDLDNLAPLSGDDAVRRWTLSRAEEYQRLALTLHSLHNAVAPVHRKLPTEIISEILAHCWQDGDSRSIRVAHVCRRWRAIAHKTPRFWVAAVAAPGSMLDFERWEHWTAATRDAHQACAATVLALASPRPVRVAVHGLPRPVAATLRLHVERVVELTVTIPSVNDCLSLRQLLRTEAPNLETLKV
ncbi:uncharacterized protein BXZ73DRAFT_44237, partial [Epithele typhae]|uniref:uncharacterized protein n=1 Tax=Epithele typhae TaxID=378194 RepID=UPI002008DDD0